MLKNPFLVYVLTFSGVLAAYQLGWSEIYPAMSLDTLAFFGLSFLVAATLGLAVSSDIAATKDYGPGLLPRYALFVLLACFAADLVYTGYVPFFEMLRGKFAYGSFVGVPSLHVFAVTFGAAFAAIRFADFLYEQDRRRRLGYLAEAMVPIVYFLLVVYRGPILITLTSWAFMFVIQRGRIGFRPAAVISVLGLSVLMLNGVIGHARSKGIEELGRPSRAFLDSGVPDSLFSAYLYATGPTANFQYAVTMTDPEYDLRKIPEFMVGEMLPDFISHRLLPLMGGDRATIPEFSAHFNVSSIFGRPYVLFGWIGALAIFTWLMTVALAYLALILRSPYRVPCLALLNTLIVFSVFDNMIAVTTLSLPLVWPLLLPALTVAPPPAGLVETSGRDVGGGINA